MTYFRNKFDEEFLFLANEQPKGASTRLDSPDTDFFIIQNQSKVKTSPNTVRVIPLVLYNRIRSSNPKDKIIEDYMALCRPVSDTRITCDYDEDYERKVQENKYGIRTVTGDFIPTDEEY